MCHAFEPRVYSAIAEAAERLRVAWRDRRGACAYQHERAGGADTVATPYHDLYTRYNCHLIAASSVWKVFAVQAIDVGVGIIFAHHGALLAAD